MADPMELLGPEWGVLRQEAVSLGLSGARVSRMLDARGRPVAFVKSADSRIRHLVHSIEAGAARLTWLARLAVPVPEVLGTGADGGRIWLATRALAGRPASDPWPEADRDAVVDLIARATRELHATVVADAPLRFDMSLSSLFPDIRERVESGLVDRSWAAAGRKGPSAAVVLAELESMVSELGGGRPAVSHGDLSLPNVLIDRYRVSGFVDVGRAGVADPHSDLADMVRSLSSHLNPQFGTASAERFLDVYGRDRVDPDRLRLHDLLEGFFWPVPEARASHG